MLDWIKYWTTCFLYEMQLKCKDNWRLKLKLEKEALNKIYQKKSLYGYDKTVKADFIIIRHSQGHVSTVKS